MKEIIKLMVARFTLMLVCITLCSSFFYAGSFALWGGIESNIVAVLLGLPAYIIALAFFVFSTWFLYLVVERGVKRILKIAIKEMKIGRG